MREVGRKNDMIIPDGTLVYLEHHVLSTGRRPFAFPALSSRKHVLVCGLDQGLGERLIVATTLAEIQDLWDQYAAGHAIQISWYEAKGEPFAMPLQAPAQC